MTGNETLHIRVTYRESGIETTRIYAVSEHISRDLDRNMEKPTGKDLQAWLEKKGCRLDSAKGPAVTWHGADGTTVEEYYRDGKRYRRGGPARVWCYPSGAKIEEYYRDDTWHREDGPTEETILSR